MKNSCMIALASKCVGRSSAAICEKLISLEGQSCSKLVSEGFFSYSAYDSRTLVISLVMLHRSRLTSAVVGDVMDIVAE